LIDDDDDHISETVQDTVTMELLTGTPHTPYSRVHVISNYLEYIT